jgi:hypothetical protein
VLKWITEGAKNVICGVAVDTANVTFSKTINPLLQTNCVGCHKTGSISGGVLLDSYANEYESPHSHQWLHLLQIPKGQMPEKDKLLLILTFYRHVLKEYLQLHYPIVFL